MSNKNTKQNKKFKLNPLAIVALVICALAVIYCATTAWLTGEPLNPLRLTTLEDFEYDVNVYFVQADGSTVAATPNANGSVAVNVDYTNPSSEKYVGKLRVEIKQNGNGVAFTRVKISHEWFDESTDTRLQGAAYLPYEINTENFADKRNVDGYIYYKGAVPVNDDITGISGFDTADFDVSAVSSMSNVSLNINVTVDAVQFNRYQQIWDKDSLPWL